jgi:adenylate kinase family enzyme
MTLIILEGQDGCGKTTLGERLSLDFNMPFHPSRGPAKNLDELLANHTKDIAITNGLLDRYTLISNWVYKRTSKQPSLHHPEEIVNALKFHPAVLIFCETDDPMPSKAPKKHKTEEDLRQCLANASRIKSRYQLMRDYLQSKHVDFIVYNWQNQPLDYLKRQIGYHESKLPTRRVRDPSS